MIKAFVYLLFLFCVAFANPILIDNSFESISTVQNQSVYKDKNQTLSANDILNNKLLQPLNIAGTKSDQVAYWNKFSVKNITDEKIILMLQNERAGTDKIDVYVYIDNTLKDMYLLGDMRDQNAKPFLSTKSIMPLIIEPNIEYVIVSKFENLGALDICWSIFTLKKFSQSNSVELIIWGLLGGIIFALILYNLIMYTSLKKIYILVYVFYAFFALIYLYTIGGVLYPLNLGVNLEALTLATWIAPALMVIMLCIFVIFFFNLKQNSKTYFILSIIVTTGNIGFLLLFLYGIFDHTIYKITPIYGIYSIITIVYLLIVSIWAYKNRLYGSIYFIIGETVYTLATIIISLNIVGFLHHIEYLQYMSSVTLVWDVVFVSIAIGDQISALVRDEKAKEKLLIEESKFAAVGKGLGNVAHQLKTPLAEISSHLLYLEALNETNKKQLSEELMDNIISINQTIEYMKNTINEIYHFYSSGSSKCLISLKTEIDLAIKMNSDNLILRNVDVQIICEDVIKIYNSKNIVANIISIFIENSLFAFALNKITHPNINISICDLDSQVTISYQDNAGGIDKNSLKNIFNIGFTTKQNNGSGLGLALAKKLIEEKLGGKIDAISINNGIEFNILINKN
ncbi:MAG: hypothetical protein RL154_358 [Pseudomonadota bacterium]|jgi:signal transduction histidine kinase